MERGFETVGDDEGFQLYLFESVGYNGGVGAHSPRTNYMDYFDRSGLYHFGRLSGGEKIESFIGHIYPPWWIYMPTMLDLYIHHAGYIYPTNILIISGIWHIFVFDRPDIGLSAYRRRISPFAKRK